MPEHSWLSKGLRSSRVKDIEISIEVKMRGLTEKAQRELTAHETQRKELILRFENEAVEVMTNSDEEIWG
jgi:hypothetical protein